MTHTHTVLVYAPCSVLYLFSSKRLMRLDTLEALSRPRPARPPPPLSSIPAFRLAFWARPSGGPGCVTGLWRWAGLGGTEGNDTSQRSGVKTSFVSRPALLVLYEGFKEPLSD